MPFCWHPQGVYCAPKKLLGSFPSVLSTTLSPSLRSCSRLLFPRGTPVTCKEKSLPSRRIAAKTPDPKISDPAPAPVQKPALCRDRQHRRYWNAHGVDRTAVSRLEILILSPLSSLMSVLVLVPARYYALFYLRSRQWRTRLEVETVTLREKSNWEDSAKDQRM